MKQILILLILTLTLFSCDTTETEKENVILSIGSIKCDMNDSIVNGFHREYDLINFTDPSLHTIKVSFYYRTTHSNTLNNLARSGIAFNDSLWYGLHGRDSIRSTSFYSYTVNNVDYVYQQNNGLIPLFFEMFLIEGITHSDYSEMSQIKVVKID
ncbi:MAG: hypothetical protein ISS16_03660 [Ignavibacteria bacterium]|nr:hypothetical protein [Ignavibacteria bacterium]